MSEDFVGPFYSKSPDLVFMSYRSLRTVDSVYAMASRIRDAMSKEDRSLGNYEVINLPHTLLSKMLNRSYVEYMLGFIRNSSSDVPVVSGGVQCMEDGSLNILTRLFVHPQHRMKLYIQHLLQVLVDNLPHDLRRPERIVFISFNDYNHALYQWFVRTHEGKSASVGRQWPEVFRVFKPVGMREVNNVMQFVCETTLVNLIEAIHGRQFATVYRVWLGGTVSHGSLAGEGAD